MKYPSDFERNIVEIAYEEINKIHGIDLRLNSIDYSDVINPSVILTLSQAMSVSMVLHYHILLREELLKHNIDIGDMEREIN